MTTGKDDEVGITRKVDGLVEQFDIERGKYVPVGAEPVAMCPCGLPLHYSSADSQAHVESVIAKKGPVVTIAIMGGRTFKVPRHYIALHGLQASEINELAAKYGFEEVVS